MPLNTAKPNLVAFLVFSGTVSSLSLTSQSERAFNAIHCFSIYKFNLLRQLSYYGRSDWSETCELPSSDFANNHIPDEQFL